LYPIFLVGNIAHRVLVIHYSSSSSSRANHQNNIDNKNWRHEHYHDDRNMKNLPLLGHSTGDNNRNDGSYKVDEKDERTSPQRHTTRTTAGATDGNIIINQVTTMTTTTTTTTTATKQEIDEKKKIQEGHHQQQETRNYNQQRHLNDYNIKVIKYDNIPWLEMTTIQYSSNGSQALDPTKKTILSLQQQQQILQQQQQMHLQWQDIDDGLLLDPEQKNDPNTTRIATRTSTNTIDATTSVDQQHAAATQQRHNCHSFQRYNGVVITTKVHWAQSLIPLKRMLCTIKAAYNRFVQYDVVVFTTIPWTQEEILELAKVVSPASLTVALDGPPLQEQLASMSDEEYEALTKRCHVTNRKEELTWFHHCVEENYGTRANLAYAWQSEFRAYHIWKHPALKEYKWMIWMDSDAICTKTWEKDPIKYMIENNLTIMYDNFPAGSTKGLDLKEKMNKAYGYAICGIWEKQDGTWFTRRCREVDVAWVTHIHGFHHITNLDVYRSEKHMSFLKLMVGDYRFSRKWDDQLGVTVPAAFEAPERVWDMRKHNMTWNIRHNGEYDGKEKFKVKNPIAWWRSEGRLNWKAGRMLCDECFDIKV
jgi:hypothetical protein